MLRNDPLNIIGKEIKRKQAYTHPLGWRILEYDRKFGSYKVTSIFWQSGEDVTDQKWFADVDTVKSKCYMNTIREPLMQDYNLINQLRDIGLIEITTDRQYKNGTRMFYDDEANCWYASYKSGYARRIYITTWPAGAKTNMYYLNKKSKNRWEWSSAILLDGENERLKLIYDRVHKYREYLEKGKDGRAYV